MARLALKPGVSYAQVGQAIANIAASAKLLDEAAVNQDIHHFRNLIDESQEGIIDGPPVEFGASTISTIEKSSVLINFHVDRTFEQDGFRVRVVNVVVPDFNDKIVERVKVGDFDIEAEGNKELLTTILNLDAIAKEAFGFITICGCAN